ncbi:hypothetical protein ACFPYI_04635 [Halomarina salina]|uniref:Uncharacterized protein n=1 Tax=Halomarina salina TaxID=1872699 RepID=A0ABD5RJ59_9EURY|nr:hypothetical protein [Halomarina salina]
MGPRYDAGYGLLLLALPTAMVVLFDVPLAPTAWAADPDVLWPAVSLCLMAVGGVMGLIAATRPDESVAGRRVDYLTFRGLATTWLALAMSVNGAAWALDGDLFGLATVASGLFLFAMGVGTMLRRPTFVPEERARRRSAG